MRRNRREIWKRRAWRFWREWVLPIGVVVAVLSTIRSAVADWNDVPTGSMKPTIIEGDRIFVNKLAYDLKLPFTTIHLAEWADPQRGDVVVLYSPENGTRLVKRVIGVPGDRIELRHNRLIVNGRRAVYEPLDPEIINQIAADEQPQHHFAGERIDDETHPVMLTPRVRAPRSFEPITVPEGQYFVMGDNRDRSGDSRLFGLVDRDLIVGRSSRVALSFDHSRWFLPRWSRFLKRLP
jgi:signal peptidase I